MVSFYLIEKPTILRKYDNTQLLWSKNVVNLDASDEEFIGIAFRPANNLLYGLTRIAATGFGFLYTLDVTAPTVDIVATAIGFLRLADQTPYILNGLVSFDFDPVSDRVRVINSLQNSIVNPNDAIVTTETSPTNQTRTPFVLFSCAYTNGYALSPPPPNTALYSVGLQLTDTAAVPTLFSIPVPSNGVLVPTTFSNVPNNSVIGSSFDIFTSPSGSNTAYLTFASNSNPVINSLYTLDLATTAVSLIGDLGINGPIVGGLAIIQPGKTPCLHPETKVTVIVNGKEQQVCIKDIKAHDRVKNIKGESIKVKNGIRFNKSNIFFRIQKGAIDTNVPENDLLIRPEHILMYQGQPVTPQRLRKKLGNEKVKKITLSKEVHVWNISTRNPQFVMMEGVPVSTWPHKNLLKQNKFNYSLY